MIIEIALGIVLAVIILALLPQIFGYAVLLLIIALCIGLIVWIATDKGMQILLAVMLSIWGITVGIAVLKEKTEKYWKPPLDKLEAKMQIHLSALISASVFGLGGIAALVGSLYYYPDYIGFTVILVFAGLFGLGYGFWKLKASRKTLGK